jgi:hypothetical protein
VILNNRLENPIHDNSIRHGCWGIEERGPMLTDIVNNEIFDSVTEGITAYLSDINGVASNTTEILIENNTVTDVYTQVDMYGNDIYGNGIYVEGVEDPNEAGEVTIANNLLAVCRGYGICPAGGWMKLATYCNGFFANNEDVFGGTGGGWISGGTIDANAIVVEDFNSYECTRESDCGDKALRAVWKDYYTNGTGALVTLWQGSVNANLVIDGNSMKYEYDDHTPDWTSGDVNTLTLYFFGQLSNDSGEQMYVKLTDGDEGDFNSVDNFDSYWGGGCAALSAVWKDYYTQEPPKTCAVVCSAANPHRGGESSWSMEYQYKNYSFDPYYSEVNATVASLGIDQNWLGMIDGTLSLWFYGQPCNDTNEPMYIKLVDGSSPEEQTATVFYSDYGDMNDVNETSWHVWNIPVGDFILANCYFDITKVAKIIIGFGDGTQAASDGTMYFEDIRLYKEYPPPEHSATVEYDGYPEYIKEPRWHVWNIPLAEFNDVNLANIAKIAIGFGDWTSPGAEPNGYGTVYFEDIILRNGPAEDIYYDGSVYLDEDPFVNGYQSWPLLLKQDCRLIDAGGEYIDELRNLVGKTTAWDGFPDYNVADIGFHYFNWYYVNTGDSNSLSADLDNSMTVDFRDFAILANDWLTSYDINNLKTMADEWLRKISLEIVLNQDSNLVSNVLGVTLDSNSDNITCYLLMDGRYIGRFCGGNVAIPTYEYSNGQHEIKVAGVKFDSEVFLGPTINIIVDNKIQYLTGSETYEYNQAFRFAGFYEPNDGNIISFEIKDLDDNVIWTNSSSGNFNFEVPAGVLQSPYNELIIQEPVGAASSYGGIKISESNGNGWIKDITKKFDITNDPNDANAKSLLVSPDEKFTEGRREAWEEFLNTCKKRGRSPTICLFDGQATRKNIETALKRSGVTLVYVISDGNREVYVFGKWWIPKAVHRTFFWASDGPYFSYLGRNWVGPGEYESLGEKVEKGYSIADLKSSFHQRNRMYVLIDACKNGTSVMDPSLYSTCSARPRDNNYSYDEYERTADMAKAFDIWEPLENKVYMGWRRVVFARDVSKWLPYTSFLKQFWYWVGEGRPFNEAISSAAHSSGGSCLVYVDFSWVGNTDISIF